jgi:L-arabinose isomerase
VVADPFQGYEVWFLTGSQGLYGEETLQQVAEQSQRVAAALDEAAEVPVRVVWKPVLTDAAAIRRAMGEANEDPACVGVVTWMHTFSPAKMWISGLDALRKPLLHLHTQADAALPWATIDMDFMNLNQAAHGDREYGFVLTRLRMPRTTVAGHVSNPRVRSRVGSWARAATAAAAARSLRLARFGDNMRNVAVTEGDKVEAEIRFGMSVNTWGVNDLVAVVEAVEEKTVDALVQEYGDLYDFADDAAPGGPTHDAVRYQARIEAALRSFLEDGGFTAFTTNFEDLGGLRQLPGLAVQRLMADGYGFGGEGDWKTAALLRTLKVAAAGLPAAPPSWRTTPTTSPGRRRSWVPTCSRSARPSPATGRGSRCTRCRSAAARTRRGWCSPRPPARASSSAGATWATGSAGWPTRSTSFPPTSRCRTCRWPARCGSPARTSRRRPRAG